jgi:hypothetical protein
MTSDANHPPEAIPDTEPPKGGGISISRGDEGQWRESIQFIPSQIIFTVGKDITIHFVGAQGPFHRIRVDGVEEEIQHELVWNDIRAVLRQDGMNRIFWN